MSDVSWLAGLIHLRLCGFRNDRSGEWLRLLEVARSIPTLLQRHGLQLTWAVRLERAEIGSPAAWYRDRIICESDGFRALAQELVAFRTQQWVSNDHARYVELAATVRSRANTALEVMTLLELAQPINLALGTEIQPGQTDRVVPDGVVDVGRRDGAAQ